MTEYLDIVEENENFRVRLEIDDSGEKPYDEGGVPIMSKEFRYGSWEADNDQAEGLTGSINAIWDAFGDTDILERFIKIFMGATSVEIRESENRRYVAFDTPEWRERMGLTDEYLAAHKGEHDFDNLAKGTMDEFIAWANGEVYGYIVERKVEWQKTYKDDPDGVMDEEGFDWVEVEDGSCWGFYGRKWAEESAREALKEAMGE